MVYKDVLEEVVTPLRDPTGDFFVYMKIVDDVDDNQNIVKELILSDDEADDNDNTSYE